MLVLGSRVGTVIDEKPGQIHITPSGCPMQRSPPVLVLGSRVGAVIDEKPGQIHITL